VTIDGVLNWLLNLLTTYTHESELQGISAPPLISIHKPTEHNKSPQHPLSLFPACSVFISRSLATPSNSGYFQLNALKSSLNGGSLPIASFPHSLPYRTDLVVPVVFFITPRHGPRRQHHSSLYAYANRFRGNVFASPSNGLHKPFIKNLLPQQRTLFRDSYPARGYTLQYPCWNREETDL
jgi:hypothetical protein